MFQRTGRQRCGYFVPRGPRRKVHFSFDQRRQPRLVARLIGVPRTSAVVAKARVASLFLDRHVGVKSRKKMHLASNFRTRREIICYQGEAAVWLWTPASVSVSL